MMVAWVALALASLALVIQALWLTAVFVFARKMKPVTDAMGVTRKSQPPRLVITDNPADANVTPRQPGE